MSPNTLLLCRIVDEMMAEAENISPLHGASKGNASPAPALRDWAQRIERIACQIERKK